MTLTADIQGLEPGEHVELFELDATGIGGDRLLFHGYVNAGPILWQGNAYQPWPIEAEGFARNGVGTLPTPLLRVGNIGVGQDGEPLPGMISALCLALDDLIGARLTRHRTLAQYLDGQPTADPTQEFPPEIWLIEAKTSETKDVVEFELRSALDFDGQQLPARQINANMCGWVTIGGYRGPYCGYTGSAMFDRDDNPVIDPTRDKCGGRMTSCKLRFGEWAELPYGGFPSADTLRGY